MSPKNNWNIIARIFLAFILGTTSICAMAWGTVGHKTIAYIAQDSLTPTAKKHVLELLSQEGAKVLTDVAMWPDQHRKEYPALPGHMVRIPLSRNSYDVQRDCRSKKLCVVEGLKQQIDLLSNRELPPAEHLQALKLVAHLVGDIHQPLHASTNTGTVAVMNGKKLTMHGLWDTQSVMQFRLTSRKLARQLEKNLPEVQQGTPEVWANESHEIAVRYFKPLLDNKLKGEPIAVPDDYLQTIAPVVKLRLQQGGVRLGRILNTIFDQ